MGQHLRQSGTLAEGLSHRWFEVEPGVRLHGVTAGDGGPLVVLLHGFPEFWFSWRQQLTALAAAGYTALALDLRGYNLSSKPRGLGAYRFERLVDDVASVIGVGRRARAVVGHDWGGVIAWLVAERYPQRLESLVAINAPHPRAFAAYVRRHPRQWLRSSYMALFLLPWVPERLLRAFGYAAVRRWRWLDRPDYVAALEQPGALTAAINYYRAALRFGVPSSPGSEASRIRTLVLWGDRDPFLARALADSPGVQVEHLPDAGHWPHLERPERISDLLIRYLAEP